MPVHILFVDDNRELVEEFVELFDEYKISTASSGKKLLNILSKPNDISLLLLDVMLPDVKGTQLLLEIKNKYPDLPVIIVTGYCSAENAIEALRGNANDFISKPFKVNEVRQIIEKVLSAGQAVEQEDDGLNSKLIQIKNFIKRNYRKKLSLDDAAAHVCLSPKYLSRLFKEKMGQGFVDYKISLKIEDSQQLLLTTDLTIDQISYKVGYDNVESFLKQFKKIVKSTPTEFRKKSFSESKAKK